MKELIWRLLILGRRNVPPYARKRFERLWAAWRIER